MPENKNKDSYAREGTFRIFIRDLLPEEAMPVTEIKVIQKGLSDEEATVKVDTDEFHFTHEGGTVNVTLSHPYEADIDISETDFPNCEWNLTSIDSRTSTLEILVYHNYEGAREGTINLRVRDLDRDIPSTQIKITQDAAPADL